MSGPTPAPTPAPEHPPGHAGAAATVAQAYWRINLRITAGLLIVWFVVTFVAAYFARELSFVFFGWPFSFWVAAQGALLVYLALIGFYAWCMNRLEASIASAEAQGHG